MEQLKQLDLLKNNIVYTKKRLSEKAAFIFAKRLIFINLKYESYRCLQDLQSGSVESFTTSYDDLVPVNHPVRIINTIVDHLDISILEKSYKGRGTSSYHPHMLLKVIIYAYLRNLYSSRK